MPLTSTHRKIGAALFTIVSVSISMVAQPQRASGSASPAAPAAAQKRSAQPGAPAIPIESLTKDKFKLLGPDALVIYKGQSMTKANFIAQRLKEWSAAPAEATTTELADGPPTADDLKRKHEAELATHNAQMQAEFKRLQTDDKASLQSPQYSALAKEANDLRNRYPSASPAKKARIKQRAIEVYRQLARMENNSDTSQH